MASSSTSSARLALIISSLRFSAAWRYHATRYLLYRRSASLARSQMEQLQNDALIFFMQGHLQDLMSLVEPLIPFGRAGDFVDSLTSAQVGCGALCLVLSKRFLPVNSSRISLSSNRISLLSCRSYIRAPVSGQVPRSIIAGTLSVLSILLHSLECKYSEMAARCSEVT